ncbi:MAG: hypothetical protein EP343_27750 [Deltaproteobacteria bacterium]|nr:MAG: hypothetical protein EP343_27750 [Deltaproteobacteria bacterium]
MTNGPKKPFDPQQSFGQLWSASDRGVTDTEMSPPSLWPQDDDKSTWNDNILGRTVESSLASIPPLRAPSLEAIQIAVPLQAPATPEQVQQRLWSMSRVYGHHQYREPGEPIQAGDDVILDVIGYANQRILPFCARESLHLQTTSYTEFPGFAEALVGMEVGDAQVLHLHLPQNFPIPELRGQPAAFAVVVEAAWHVTPLTFDNPNNFAHLERGDSWEALLTSVLDEMEIELATLTQRQVSRQVLELLCQRAPTHIPKRLIDEEIRQQWMMCEGHFLQSREMEPDDMEFALLGWLGHPGLREEARYRVHSALVLRAVSEQLAPPLQPFEFRDFVAGLVEVVGFDLNDVMRSLERDPRLHQILLDRFLYLRTLGFVLSYVQFSA